MSGTNRMSPKMTRAVASLLKWEQQPERFSAQGIYLNATTARALVARGIAVYVAGKATRLSPEYRAQLDICSRHGLSRTGQGCADCNAAETSDDADALTVPGRDTLADCGLSANGSAPCVLIAGHGGEWHMATGYAWFRDVPPADAQVNPHEWIADAVRSLNRPTEPRRFGVSVEWCEDPAVRTGVIGSYGTYLEAKAAVDRMRASGRWDVVTGVMALYATESDV